MSQLQVILVLLLGLSLVAAYLLYRRGQTLETNLREAHAATELAENERKGALKQAEESQESVKKLQAKLQESKNKLRKRAAKEQGKRGGKAEPEPEGEAPKPGAATVVRVSNQDLQAQFEKKQAELQAEIQTLKAALSQTAAQKAALEAKLQPSPEVAETEAEDPEERIQNLRGEIVQLKEAAAQAKKKQRQELSRLEARMAAASKRASSNHSLYAVLKAQLEMTEDKLAHFKQKYEGAVSPSALAELHPEAEAPVEAEKPVEAAEAEKPVEAAEVEKPAEAAELEKPVEA